MQKFEKETSDVNGATGNGHATGSSGTGGANSVGDIENQIKKSDILSPTFNIVYDYQIRKTKIHHYDLYRLKSNKDILELGMFDNSKECIKIIEWPELIESKPKDRIDLFFEYTELEDIRHVKIIGFGKWKDYKFNGI